MNAPSLIAQIAQELPPLYTYGPMGIMLAWFMWITKDLPKDVKMLAHRVDGLTRALLVDMAERESCGERTKAFAREEVAKIDARLAK